MWISVYVEILNWHTANSALEYSNFPFLKIPEKCRYCIKHSETQCKVNLEKKSGTNISLKGGQLKSCKLRNISEHEDIARAYNIVEKFKIHLRKDVFLPCLWWRYRERGVHHGCPPGEIDRVWGCLYVKEGNLWQWVVSICNQLFVSSYWSKLADSNFVFNIWQANVSSQ